MTDHDIWRKSYLSAAHAAATRAKWWRRAWRMLAVVQAVDGYWLQSDWTNMWYCRGLGAVNGILFCILCGLGQEHFQFGMRQRQAALDTLHELEREWREQR